MSFFDEQPDAPLHGECAAEIHRLEAQLSVANELIRKWYAEDAAATQADNARLREAIKLDIGPITNATEPNLWEALAIPLDTSALDELKAGYEARIAELRNAVKEVINGVDGDEYVVLSKALSCTDLHEALNRHVAAELRRIASTWSSLSGFHCASQFQDKLLCRADELSPPI